MNNIDKQLDLLWKNNPETIKKFIEQRNDYEQLCSEIAYILRKRIFKANIEISSVSNRAKTLKSFLEKISRKTYENPFVDLTDFAGVRVVFLYQSDLKKIETIIKREFTVVEKVDKLNDKGVDKFGYGAIHFIVKLGKGTTGARYDDLKDLKCEIQIRTVLQDAWAIIDHHLVYKRESDIPSTLQRKLNSLAGLFETADDQFNSIRNEREKYLKDIDASISTPSFLKSEMNLDTFTAYLKYKFPDMKVEYFDGQIGLIYDGVSQIKFKTLSDLDKIIQKNLKFSEKVKEYIIDKFGSSVFMNNEPSSSAIVLLLLTIESEKYINHFTIKDELKEALRQFPKS